MEGDELTGREAEGEDKLKMDGRRFGSGSPGWDVRVTEGEEEGSADTRRLTSSH
jgi:hypothetical protein